MKNSQPGAWRFSLFTRSLIKIENRKFNRNVRDTWFVERGLPRQLLCWRTTKDQFPITLLTPCSHLLAMHLYLQVLTSILFVSHVSIACYIAGTDSGECTTSTAVLGWRQDNMPYCQFSVLYPACVPKEDLVSFIFYVGVCNFHLCFSFVRLC